jgi:GDP-L-fucose synthase
MKILITGASGFLGKNLKKELVKSNQEVTGIGSRECNLTKEGSLENYLGYEKFDRIFHLAAWTQAGDFCLHHPGEQWLINQKINTNVLSWWKERQPQAKMTCIGTSCVYDPSLELKEENYLRGEPVESLFTYAYTKKMLYLGLSSIHNQFGLEYNNFIPPTLYGPDYHLDQRQPHFIFDLAKKIVNGKLNSEDVVLWGDGYQKREVIHVKDFVKIIARINEEISNQNVNVGTGIEHSIRTFAKEICDLTGYDSNRIKYDLNRYVGARSKCLDVSKLKKLMPDYSPISLQEGLKEVVQWYEQELKK